MELDDVAIMEIAQAWSDANGTWGQIKLFFDSRGLTPWERVKHRGKLEDQVAANVGRVQELLEGRCC